jgi:hypothetical protein
VFDNLAAQAGFAAGVRKQRHPWSLLTNVYNTDLVTVTALAQKYILLKCFFWVPRDIGNPKQKQQIYCSRALMDILTAPMQGN